MDLAPEELAGLRARDLQRAAVWVTPAWALGRRVPGLDRLLLLQVPGMGIRVEVMRMLPTDSLHAATAGYAYLGLLEQELRASHRIQDATVDTRLDIPRWSRLANGVAHSWMLTTRAGDALDAYLAALHLDARAHARASATLGVLVSDRALTPHYHRWEARLADGGWGPQEPLFAAVARRHDEAGIEGWAARRRLARVAIATGRVRPAPEHGR